MQLTTILGIFAISLSTIGLACAIGFFIWIKTRKKKVTWKAKIYKKGSGVVQRYNETGNPIGIKLNDLRPYAEDTLEETEDEHGVTQYRLVKLGRITSAITPDCEEQWGTYKEVRLLQEGNSIVPLQKGYDTTTGDEIFTPLPYDEHAMLMQEMREQHGRREEKKDVLLALVPYVIAAFGFIAMMAISYIVVDGLLGISSDAKEMMESNEEIQTEIMESIERISENLGNKNNNIGGNLGRQSISNIPPNLTVSNSRPPSITP